jgi:hypothetical protein
VSDPLTLQDRVEISDLFARYAWCLDTRDVEGFASNFAPNGAIDDPAYPGRQHFIAQSLFDGDGNRCRVRSYAMVTSRKPDGACAVLSLGHYDDVCVKLEGHWVFAERVFKRWAGDVLQAFGQ